jgi:phosphate starvation-inducible protein PhoH and related proteins
LQLQTRRLTVGFDDADSLRSLCGERDRNLRWLESRMGISVVARGTEVHLSGSGADVDLAGAVLRDISSRIDAGDAVDGDMMRRLVDQRTASRSGAASRANERRPPAARDLLGRTPGQRAYVRAIASNDVVFGVGPAGTGKTFLAVACALEAVQRHEVRKIILTRPAVEAGERLGFLPGDLAAKVNPYLRPLFDALIEITDRERVDRMIEREQVEVAPLAFMRGRTLSSAYVILDEAQNCSSEQMAMLLTRLGPDSKCIVTGDPSQSDLPRGIRPGLSHSIDLLEDVEGVEVVRLAGSDVVRHPLVARIAAAYAADAARRTNSSNANRRRDDR